MYLVQYVSIFSHFAAKNGVCSQYHTNVPISFNKKIITDKAISITACYKLEETKTGFDVQGTKKCIVFFSLTSVFVFCSTCFTVFFRLYLYGFNFLRLSHFFYFTIFPIYTVGRDFDSKLIYSIDCQDYHPQSVTWKKALKFRILGKSRKKNETNSNDNITESFLVSSQLVLTCGTSSWTSGFNLHSDWKYLN